MANDPAAQSWFPGLRIVADAERGLGPLAGIATALEAAHGAPAIVLAWDMPFVPTNLLAELRRLGNAGGTSSAAVPKHGGVVEPLCAWYAPPAAEVCRTLLEAGERRAGALAMNLPSTIWLDDAELASFGDVSHIFTSVDTPEGLRALGGAHP